MIAEKIGIAIAFLWEINHAMVLKENCDRLNERIAIATLKFLSAVEIIKIITLQLEPYNPDCTIEPTTIDLNLYPMQVLDDKQKNLAKLQPHILSQTPSPTP
jgi:hypothetical protein